MKALLDPDYSQLSDKNPLTHKYIPGKRFPKRFIVSIRLLMTGPNFIITQIYLQSCLKIPPCHKPTINFKTFINV